MLPSPWDNMGPSPFHLFDDNATEDGRATAMTIAATQITNHHHRTTVLPPAWLWWPALLWIQYGAASVCGDALAACVPDPHMAGLLRSPLSLAVVIECMQDWTSRDNHNEDTARRCALDRWLNANEWTTDPREFFVARLYHLLRRTVPVAGGPRFEMSEVQVLTTFIRENRPKTMAVYAFAMLLRHANWHVALQACEEWLGDAQACNWVALCSSLGQSDPISTHCLPSTSRALRLRWWTTHKRDVSTEGHKIFL